MTMKHKIEELATEESTDTKRNKKLKKEFSHVKNAKAKKQKSSARNDSEETFPFDSNEKKKMKKNEKKFKFKSKFGEKKGKGGTFSPKKLAITEEDKKALRKKQKLLRIKRREKERGYALHDEAKKIFEEMRCNKCPAEKRVELSKDLFTLLSGKISSAVKTHDLARMIQWLIKVGPPDVKENITNEVIDDTVNLSKSKYSNHIILRILKDCDKRTRRRVLAYLIGNITKLMKIRFAVTVVEEYYSNYANSKEKAYMRQELYSDLFRGGRNPALTSLSEVLAQNSTLTSAILKSTKTILSKLIDKPSSLSTNLVTDVLYDYLQHCEEQDKLDILEILKSNIQNLSKTKSGNMVLMFLLWESTAKVKKTIVKELKTRVLEIAKSEGNAFIRSLFDSVDDTVLVKKAILPPILDNVEDLVKNVHGRRVILYLVAHRDTLYFHPKELNALKKADESANVKKDISVKEKELLGPCVDTLLSKIKENPEFWFSEACIAVITLAVLKKGQGEALTEAYQAISALIVKNISEDNLKIIDDCGTHMVLKKLIKKDTDSTNDVTFSEHLVKSFSAQTVEKLLSFNRGCFLLVLLIESNVDAVLTRMKKLLKKANASSKLETQDSKGAEILKRLISDKSLL